ncbi:AAA family ATPase [Kribbella sp. CA-294648]|uniref:AAA family ATPase n=1 Tax=Kribbella sp. CA-294648 TaxID=3239948 RepID=UPI003D8BEF41
MPPRWEGSQGWRRLLLVGDDAQIGAIETGGAFRLSAKEVIAAPLTEVWRFNHAWQREARLTLRNGAPNCRRRCHRHPDSKTVTSLAMLVERVFPAGSEFAEAGFLLIAAGRASLTVDGNPVRSLGPGDHIGAAALVGLPRGALVTALTDMRCLAMPWPVFRQLLDANPRIAGELLIAMGTQPAPSSGAEGDERRRGSARTRRRATSTASHLSTASDEAATALLPAFVVGTLGASPLALGLIEGLANAADGVARLGGGALSENPRRRPLISMVAFTLTAVPTTHIGSPATTPHDA